MSREQGPRPPGEDPLEPRESVRELQAYIVEAEGAGVPGKEVRAFLQMSSTERTAFMQSLSGEDTFKGMWLESIARKVGQVQAEGVGPNELGTADLIDYLFRTS